MNYINDVQEIMLSSFFEVDGEHLVVAEGKENVPFEIKRLFFIYGMDSEIVRGKHANRKSKFLLTNISGSSRVKVMGADGYEKEYVLDKPGVAVYIPEMVWKEMYDFSEDSVLLVLSSEHYDAEEYIRDYQEYLDLI